MAKARVSTIIWGDEADPDGIIQYIADHGVTTEEVEEVLLNPENESMRNDGDTSLNTRGWTLAGRYLLVAWDWADETGGVAYIITAYGPDEEN